MNPRIIMKTDNDMLKASFGLGFSNTNNKAVLIIITPLFTQTLNVGYSVKINPNRIFRHKNNKLIENINRFMVFYFNDGIGGGV